MIFNIGNPENNVTIRELAFAVKEGVAVYLQIARDEEVICCGDKVSVARGVSSEP